MTQQTDQPGPREIGSLEELRGLLGEELGVSAWVQVTQEQVDAFADATGDHQWIHVDPERAAASPFGGTIAHGFLTLSLIPSFAVQIFALSLGGARLNYGLDGARFPTPVRVGSRVRGRATITDVAETPKGVRVTTSYVIEIEGAERPACVATQLTLVTG